jgi:acetyl esterase/lipase
VRIPGYWLDKSGHNIEPGAPPTPGEKVVLALHGGAYVIGSAYPDDVTANIAKGLLEHTPGDGNIDGHANANSRADASANGSASSSSSPSVNGSSSSSSSSSSGSYLRRVFSVEYRLAIGPPGQPPAPFPAALIDALAGYDYLVNTVGFAPEDVVVDGDSAGGNLALALVRYLVEEKEFLSSVGSVDSVSSGSSTGTGADTSTTGTGARDKERKRKPLTPPGGLLLFSPWSDLGTSHEQPASQTPSYFRRTDYIGNMPEKDAKWAHGHFAGPMGVEALEANRWTSPASKHVQLKGATRKGEKHREGSSEGDEGTKGLFAGFPRTFLVCGGSEYLAPAIRTLKERLAVDLGEGGANGLSYHEAPDGVHDYCAMPWFDPARTETLKAVGRWIAEM